MGWLWMLLLIALLTGCASEGEDQEIIEGEAFNQAERDKQKLTLTVCFPYVAGKPNPNCSPEQR